MEDDRVELEPDDMDDEDWLEMEAFLHYVYTNKGDDEGEYGNGMYEELAEAWGDLSHEEAAEYYGLGEFKLTEYVKKDEGVVDSILSSFE